MAAITAFREPSLISKPVGFQFKNFSDFSARRARYDIFWSMYENTAYRNVHYWGQAYKTQYGLYRYIRNIYNPAYRLGEFWKAHLLAGALDRQAGEQGAIPVMGARDALRQAIARLWRSSVWQIKKDVLSLYGAIMGDVGINIIDDPVRQQVYLQVVHPGIIEDVGLDPFGNVKNYTLNEEVRDPQGGQYPVTYREEATRDGDLITFKTYLNGQPHAWNGQTATWSEPYGFCPFVVVKHNDVGLDWGWSELHAGRSKIHEVDDIASQLNDHIRRYVNPIWLFSGLRKSESTPDLRGEQATADKPEPGRDEVPAIYAQNSDAKAKALVTDLDINAVLANIDRLLAELERDYPELNLESLRASGQVTGRALQLARAPAGDKVIQRRAVYDEALTRAIQMAVAIGGFRNYPGYEAFNLDSYRAGDLDFVIGDRPVFRELETDDND